MVVVRTPVPGVSDEVAGVVFVDGKGETSDPQAIGWFRRNGYLVGDEPAATPAAVEPPDPRDIGADGDGVLPLGTKLRDAAVDPRDGDFLEPVNAGAENPHGPLVVAPGLHAVAPPPLVPGPVVSDPRQQDFHESDAAQAILMEGQDVGEAMEAIAEANPVPDGVEDASDVEDQADDDLDEDATDAAADDGGSSVERPAITAKVAEWRAYAVAMGMSEEEAKKAAKPDLIAMYPDGS